MTNNYGFPFASGTLINPATGTLINQNIKTGCGAFAGFIPTVVPPGAIIAVSDGTTGVTSGTIMANFTPVAGTMYTFMTPVEFKTGLTISGSGSIIGTIAYL